MQNYQFLLHVSGGRSARMQNHFCRGSTSLSGSREPRTENREL